MAGLFLLAVLPSYADEARVRDIDIEATVRDDGAIDIVERWDVTVTSGTEWYLVRNNLGEISIEDFKVNDNVQGPLRNIGKWDVDASRQRKAGKCGINRTDSGVELCWGIGEYGDHIFTASYTMTNACKSAPDADYLHIQFVSPGISPAPENVTLHIRLADRQIDSTFARVWGFGYQGVAQFCDDGSLLFESDGYFGGRSSMIALVKFDKGHIHPVCESGRTFEEVREMAFEGSSYSASEEDPLEEILGAVVGVIVSALALIGLAVGVERRKMRNILGPQRKDGITWFRDPPYGGNLLAANVVATLTKEVGDKGNITSAMVLRMIQKGALTSVRNAKGKVELVLGDAGKAGELGEHYVELRDMLSTAAGDDGILQENEFRRWARKHTGTLTAWGDSVVAEGRRWLAEKDLMHGDKSTEAGIAEARNLLGLKKYLSEFTLVSERETPEVVLWQDYLTFATLFGIADKVAAQLKEINADIYRETVGGNDISVPETIYLSRFISRSIQSAVRAAEARAAAQSASNGFGGSSSFGGGGGFSGGGFGGGSR